jgi:hypothetical protein
MAALRVNAQARAVRARYSALIHFSLRLELGFVSGELLDDEQGSH